MSLSNNTLEQLAKKSAGVGRSATNQPSSPYTSYPNAAAASGNGVDVSSAIWAEVIVRPTGGDAVFTIFGRSIGDTDFDALNQAVELDAAETRNFKEVINVRTLAELYVVVDSATASSVAVVIAPCNG